MQLFYAPDIKMSPELPEEEALHCLRVLRLGAGSRVRLTDGRGFFYDAVLSSVAGKRCAVSVEKVSPWEKTWRGHLHMAVAPTKNMDRMEWFVEKAVEIGVEMIACTMSMDVMGVKKEELLDNVTLGGVATYLERTDDANLNLFI